MWKCSNCGTLCSSRVCGRCGLAKSESLLSDEEVLMSEDIEGFVEAVEMPPHKRVDEKVREEQSRKAESKREKRVAKLEKQLERAKIKEAQIPTVEKLSEKIKYLKLSCVALIGVLIVVIGLFAGLGMHQKKQLTSLQTQVGSYDSVMNENSNLASEVSELTSKNSELTVEIKQLRDEKTQLEAENGELREASDFLKEQIKIVEDDDDKTYHTYGCKYFDTEKFWAYNSGQVVGKWRYTECPECN